MQLCIMRNTETQTCHFVPFHPLPLRKCRPERASGKGKYSGREARPPLTVNTGLFWACDSSTTSPQLDSCVLWVDAARPLHASVRWNACGLTPVNKFYGRIIGWCSGSQTYCGASWPYMVGFPRTLFFFGVLISPTCRLYNFEPYVLIFISFFLTRMHM